MSATIVIPQHGNSNLTVRCVRSLRRSDVRDWPIVVVSDGCPSAELAILQAELSRDLQISILTQVHRGVTAAWNLGAKAAKTEGLIFLNNDVVCQGDWGEIFLRRVRDHGGLCGTAWRRQVFPKGLNDGVQSLRMFQGWCLGMPRDLFEALNGFDESLALYWSDTDFQMRYAEMRGGWGWLRDGLVEALPLRHLKHRTTRTETLQRWCREQWERDRRTFVSQWRARLDSLKTAFPWEQDFEAVAGL